MVENKRLNILIRKNAGIKILPKIRSECERILGRKVLIEDFLPLTESDAIRRNFYEEFRIQDSRDDIKILVSTNPNDILFWLNTNLKVGVYGYLFFRDADKIGGIYLMLEEFIKNALNLLYLDGDTVFYVSKCNKIKLYLTYYLNDSDEAEYEVISLL